MPKNMSRHMPKNSLTLLLPQKVKTPYIKEGLSHYLSKIKSYASLSIVEPKSEEAFQHYCQRLEKETITIVLDEKGRQFN